MNIAPRTDTNGLADIYFSAANGSVDYNIQVDSAGNYPLNFRVAGATGPIKVRHGSTLLGTPATAWFAPAPTAEPTNPVISQPDIIIWTACRV